MRTVKIFDSTIENAAKCGVKLSFKEKLDAVKLLDELKVDAVRLGFIGGSKEDSVFARTLAATVKCATLCCSVGLDKAEADEVLAVLKETDKKRIVIDLPVSPALIEYKLGKKPQVALETLKDVLSYVAAAGVETEVRLIDAINAERAFLYNAMAVAAECGAKDCTLSEEASSVLPKEFAVFVSDAVKKADELGIALNVSVKNTLGLSLALAEAAISVGANGIETAFGDSGRVGADALISLISAVGNREGYAVNAVTTAVNRITADILAVIGEKSETPLKVALIEDKILPPETTEEELFAVIKKLGYEISYEDLKKVYEAFTRIMGKKGRVNVRELDALIATYSMQVPSRYMIVDYIINSGNIIRSTASVTLERDGEKLFGLSHGDGPIDAAFHAIESITGSRYELDDFKIESLTEGKDAAGRAIVKLRSAGVVYVGAGISTDIVGASIRAYVAALNKIAFGETEGIGK